MWSVVKENVHLVHLKEEQITNETKFEFLTKEEEECIVLFHNIRNLDVKLQLGHPLPLKTLDLTMISINSYWVGKIHQHQICIGFPRWWSI